MKTFLSAILILLSTTVQAAITASLDRETIVLGDTVRLNISATGQSSGGPDTGPLGKDFEILGTSSGSQVSIINGRMDARSTWTITLSPRHKGQLTIPALTIDGQTTPPITLTVTDAPTVATGSGSPIYLESEVSNDNPYVQGMVLYRLKLYHSVKISDGTLIDPQHDDAIIKRLGQDKEYSVERDGIRYRVLERDYLIWPQASGELTLQSPRLRARIPDTSGQQRAPGSLFGRHLSGSTRLVQIKGDTRTLSVRPRPATAKGDHWLPADKVELRETWSPDHANGRVGDPITRKVDLTALGMTGEQLPDLTAGDGRGFKVYADKPTISNRPVAHSVQGVKQMSFTYVPTAAGELTLPAISLSWWDVNEDAEHVIQLPARTLSIAAAPGTTASPPPAAAPNAAPLPGKPAPAQPSTAGDRLADMQAGAVWLWLSIAFATLWIATLYLWWRRGHGHAPRQQDQPASGDGATSSPSMLKKSFHAACNANDARAARQTLLQWAAQHWPDDPPQGLEDLAARIHRPEITTQLRQLDSALYATTDTTWQGAALADSLKALPSPAKPATENKTLPDLYPPPG